MIRMSSSTEGKDWIYQASWSIWTKKGLLVDHLVRALLVLAPTSQLDFHVIIWPGNSGWPHVRWLIRLTDSSGRNSSGGLDVHHQRSETLQNQFTIQAEAKNMSRVQFAKVLQLNLFYSWLAPMMILCCDNGWGRGEGYKTPLYPWANLSNGCNFYCKQRPLMLTVQWNIQSASDFYQLNLCWLNFAEMRITNRSNSKMLERPWSLGVTHLKKLGEIQLKPIADSQS